MNMPCWTFVLMGATGDLSRRKLFPALYALFRSGIFNGCIIGTGREHTTTDIVLERARPFIESAQGKIDEVLWRAFIERVTYVPLDVTNPEDFERLSREITGVEKANGLSGHRIIYLATAADLFCTITQQVVAHGIVQAHDDNYRIVYEKPFGWDLESARALNTCIKQTLAESQVYRIDHYLAKEFVSNIALLRFTNTLFKRVWDNSSIDAVKIYFTERITLEGRGSFFDRYGILKDVVQNHVLQLLALTTMDEPLSLTSEELRDKKAAILSSIRVVDGVLGQYQGYLDEPGVAQNSKTETYAALKLFVDHPGWQGVPFYIIAGKGLPEKNTAIELFLKPVPFCPWTDQGLCKQNKITLRINPQEGFSLQVNTKKPRTLDQVTPVTLDFSWAATFGPTSPEAYEILLEGIMAGNQSLVVRFDEIVYQWELIESIYRMQLPLFTYTIGSEGPIEARALLSERGMY